jgi:Protein of unknown function (DUF3099)
MTGGSPARGARNRQEPAVITDARTATSAELDRRIKRYAITMAFRTACFVAMIFVPGVGRWILFGCAVFLPYVAVLLANQAHTRQDTTPVAAAAPEDTPQLTAGPAEAEIITGDVPGEASGARSQPDDEDRVA